MEYKTHSPCPREKQETIIAKWQEKLAGKGKDDD